MKSVFSFVSLFFVCLSLSADVDELSKKEINHLLSYVQNSKCTYIRNGTSYNSKKARNHIERKYKYFEDEIQSTEDFIRLSATKSMMFSSRYFIKCPHKKKIESSKWLLKELHQYRNMVKSYN